MNDAQSIRKRLQDCPAGRDGWKQFEDICIEALRYLFVPPLTEPIIQPRTYSGIDRRDAVFPNRNMDEPNNWGHLLQELSARMILVEFKNYDAEEIGKEETNQTRNYLSTPMGKLAIMVGIKGVGSLFLTRVSGIDTRAVCPAAPALQLEILRIMS